MMLNFKFPYKSSVFWFSLLLFFFALSFTVFAIQSGDVLMYLALARDFLLKGQWPAHDPYIYSLPSTDLYIAHEYLSYLLFYGAWSLAGIPGLIALKVFTYAILFVLVLKTGPQKRNASPLWMALWLLAVLAGSFRFIERASMFSDLFCVTTTVLLLGEATITRRLIVQLSLLFLLWVQLHPGYPIGLALLGLWTLFNIWQTPGFFSAKLLWLLLPIGALLLNPLGLNGALYPFHFAIHEALVLKHFNFEWFPAYHPAFRAAPETLAFWVLCVASLILLWREKSWRNLRTVLLFATIASAVQAVRFVPWASFAILVLIKPWAEIRQLRIPLRYLSALLAMILLFMTIHNFTKGYLSSAGPRAPRLTLDSNFFPSETFKTLRAQPIPGHLYNAHDFGSFLIWQEQTPIFHHGFVTDMDFYVNDVVGVFKNQERFLELAKKYGWTMLLVDKHGSYPYFYKILSPLPDWKIVAEDDAAYLIYLVPDNPPSH